MEKKNKILNLFLLLLVMVFSLTSCDEEEQNQKPKSNSLNSVEKYPGDNATVDLLNKVLDGGNNKDINNNFSKKDDVFMMELSPESNIKIHFTPIENNWGVSYYDLLSDDNKKDDVMFEFIISSDNNYIKSLKHSDFVIYYKKHNTNKLSVVDIPSNNFISTNNENGSLYSVGIRINVDEIKRKDIQKKGTFFFEITNDLKINRLEVYLIRNSDE